MGCGGARVAAPAGDEPAIAHSPLDPAPATPPKPPLPVVDESSDLGPFLPPETPPTRYAPRTRRAVTPAPPLPTANNRCHQAVEVRNYDGQDGCGLLLETDDGNLFVVGNTPRGEPLEAGTRISIGYEYVRNPTASPCANADAVVHVTCMRLLRVSSGLPQPVVCESYDVPSEWLVNLARDYSATYITRFPWREDRYAYLLETPFGQYLYDCRGYLVCKPRKNCISFVDDASAGVVIYEN